MTSHCNSDHTNDRMPVWTPLVFSGVGIPLCGLFTVKSIQQYRHIMARRQRCRLHCHASEALGPLSNGWMRLAHLIRAAWPRTVNQILTTLAALSWISLFFDQMAITIYDVTLIFLCPEFNCRNATKAKTPGCAASSIYRAIPTLQTLGYCFFSLTSINRFVSVYSMLSLRRTRAVQVGTAVTVAVTVFRLCTLPFLEHMSYVPVSWSSHEFARNAQVGADQLAMTATTLYLLGYFGFFIIVAMADIPCTVLAVQYTMQCRQELKRAHNKDDLGLMTSGTIESAPLAVAGGQAKLLAPPAPRIMASAPESEKETLPKSPSAFFQRSSFRRVIDTLKQRRKIRKRATEAVTTRIVVLVVLKVALLAIFVLVRSLLSDMLSAHISTSMMTLTLKLVVAVASMTITSMTQLVALKQ